jgi:hypothetical protein
MNPFNKPATPASGTTMPTAYPEFPAEKPDIRLLAIDLDDTLLTDDMIITPRAKRAIQSARQQGVVVTIATGRMFESTLPYADELEIDVPLITFQGALVIMRDGRVISHKPMEHDLSVEVLDFLLTSGCHVTVYIKEKLYVEEVSPFVDRYRRRIRIELNEVPSLRTMMAESPAGATKFCLLAEKERIEEVIGIIHNRFGSRIQAVPSKPTFLEISRPDVGKGVSLAEMADDMGITREQVMAIGDSPNDQDMISYAGWGVVMANGLDSVKEAARWITASNNEEGVAIAIEHLVLK